MCLGTFPGSPVEPAAVAAGAAAEAPCWLCAAPRKLPRLQPAVEFHQRKLRSKLRHLVDRIVLLGTGQVTDAGSASKVFRHFGGRFVESL